MNTIYKKQNEKYMLMLQYSAKRHYNRAEWYAKCSWFICIAGLLVKIPCIASYLGVWAVVIPMTMAIFSLRFVAEKTKECMQIGAATRQLIDYKLFGFSCPIYFNNYTEEQLKEYAATEKNTHSQDYIRQINHCGTDKEHGVKDWYTIDENVQQEQAVRECQRQNKLFDNMLTKSLIIFVILLFVVAAIVFVILYGNDTVNDAILSLSFITPLITKASGTIRSYLELWRFNVKWKDTFCKTNISCEERQACIDERRRIVFIVPHRLHSFWSRKLHSIVDDSTNK